MTPELLAAFDALAPECEVSAPLCAAAGRGQLDLPFDIRAICTLSGLPGARAANVERTLAAGQRIGLFVQAGPSSWRTKDYELARRLTPLLEGARLYRTRVHQDIDVVEVVLTRPPVPSQVSRKLEGMLSGGWGFRDTRQLLPAIAEAASSSLIVMTPFFDRVGAEVVLNLFANTSAVDKCLILRAGKDGTRPEGLTHVGAQLANLGVEVLNFRLENSNALHNETFHAKAVLQDDVAAYVGSSNMNQWSFGYSLELGMFVRGKAASKIAELMRAVRAVSRTMT